MKQRLILIGALLLLLAVIGFMASDLFFGREQEGTNPYEYSLDSLKKVDPALNRFTETLHFGSSLETITALTTDGESIFVAGKDGIEIFDGQGKPLKHFKIEGTPDCLALDATGNMFLGMQDHVEVLDAAGKPIALWPAVAPGSVITSIAVTRPFVFVADAGMKVVYRYDHKGKLYSRIGEKDPERNIPGFVIPSPYFDLGIGRKGELWVVNPGRHTLGQFEPDGRLVASWGLASMTVEGFSGCCNPSHFAILSDGSFVTGEKGIERIKIYSPAGDFVCVVAAPDQFDEGTRGLDLAVDKQDRILVLDPTRKQVRIFVPAADKGGNP
jgi:sugar lactone lactonase YvrE